MTTSMNAQAVHAELLRGKIVVIKYGGNAMTDGALQAAFAALRAMQANECVSAKDVADAVRCGQHQAAGSAGPRVGVLSLC